MNRSVCLVWIVIAVVAGCASDDSASTARWSSRARDIAQQRLAAAREAQPPEVLVPQYTLAPSPLVAEERRDGNADPAVGGYRRPTVVPLALLHLAADTPAGQEPTRSEAPSADAEEAGIERGPLTGFRETVKRDLIELPGSLWEDTKRVYTDPLNVVFLVGAGGASLALRPEVDDDIEDYYDRHHTLKHDWRDAFGAAGNPGTHFAMAGAWYLAGQQLQDAKTYEVGKRMFSALTITGLSTMLLKVAANTESPNGEELAWPSGHVSSTMAMATVLNDAYGPVVGVPMFGLTALVGLERLDSGEHHFSDLVFGAALGWVVAETVMKEHRPEIFGGEIAPYVDPVNNNAGVAWIKTLGQ